MFESLVEMRWPISVVLSDEKMTKTADQSLDLKNEQWRELFKTIIGTIETVTVFIIGEEEKASVSSVLPICTESLTISALHIKLLLPQKSLRQLLLNQLREDEA